MTAFFTERASSEDFMNTKCIDLTQCSRKTFWQRTNSDRLWDRRFTSFGLGRRI